MTDHLGSSAPGFDDQVRRLVELGSPGSAGLSQAAFRARLEPLRDAFDTLGSGHEGALPPIIVLSDALAPPAVAVGRVGRTDGKPGTVIGPRDVTAYRTVESIGIPDGDAYLIAGVDLGAETRNEPPAVALARLEVLGRTPLTIAEGLALHAQIPAVISPNSGFSLAGSTRGDRRVPALWVSRARPKLGWCYMGAPHTWLGTASCTGRIVA